MSGILYLVATPIGNLDDITLRAIKVLQEVDIIASEDTRHSLKLLNHLNISKPLISYHRHNEQIKSETLINHLLGGKNIAFWRRNCKTGYRKEYKNCSYPWSMCFNKCINIIWSRFYRIYLYRFSTT